MDDRDNIYCMNASRKRNCPSCKEGKISALMLFRSVSGIGPNPRCHSCRTRLSVGSTWQGNFVGFLLLALFYAAASSIAERNYVPYLIVSGSLALASFVVWRYATMKVVVPLSTWQEVAHYFVLALFIVVLMYFNK